MYCTQCGQAIESHARFCQRCGARVEAPIPRRTPPGRVSRMEVHFQALGWMMIASAILSGLFAAGTFGAGWFIQAVGFRFPDPPMGLDPAAFFGVLASGLGILLAVVSALSAVAGIGLLQYQSWGRPLALLAAALMVTRFPIGTAIAVYAFWVLLSFDGRRYFRSRVDGEAATPAA